MSLLPKSNDWCRRYLSKFNSGWECAGLTERSLWVEVQSDQKS